MVTSREVLNSVPGWIRAGRRWKREGRGRDLKGKGRERLYRQMSRNSDYIRHVLLLAFPSVK